MKSLELFLSLRGRIGRLVYFLGIACNLLALPTVFFLTDIIRTLTRGGRLAEMGEGLFLAALSSTGILMVWSVLTLFVRRVADQDISRDLGAMGGLMFIGSILALAWPFISPASSWMPPVLSPKVAYALIYVVLVLSLLLPGLRPGTRGVNRFGPDPEDETSPSLR